MKALDIADFLGLPWKIFGTLEDPYLLRIHLTPTKNWWRRRLPGVCLNYFFRGDKDPEFHNHEWSWSCAFVVSNGYTEYRKDGRYAPVREITVRPGNFNFIWKDTFHRLELDDPRRGAWTLFVMAPRDVPDGEPSEWGFTPEDGSSYESHVERSARLHAE